MPVEKINHYKKTMRLRFNNDSLELLYQNSQQSRGRSSAVYSLATLAVMNLTFAVVEFWILGLNSTNPLYSYLTLAGMSLMMAVFTGLSSNTAALKFRTLVPGLMTLSVLIWAVYLEHYRIYHAVEISLLLVWLGSLNVFSFRSFFTYRSTRYVRVLWGSLPDWSD